MRHFLSGFFVGGLALSGIGAVQASADVITDFNFTGNTGAETSVSAATPAPTPGVSTSSITRGAGFGVEQYGSYTHNSFGVNPSATGINGKPAGFESTVSSADANGQYVTFTITPSPGNLLSLSDAIFSVGIQNGPGANTIFPALQYSTDGVTFSPVNSVTDSGGNGSIGAYPNSPVIGTFDLSSTVALQDDALPITLRLYVLSTNGNGYEDGGFGYSSANSPGIVVDGSVAAAIPEPGSLGLLAVVAGTCLSRRRRRIG